MPSIVRPITTGSEFPTAGATGASRTAGTPGVRILGPDRVFFPDANPTPERAPVRQKISFDAITDPFKLAAYERGVGFPKFRDRGFWDLTYPVQMAVNAHLKAHPKGTWINLGSRGQAQADFANDAVRFAVSRQTEIPAPRLIALDREPENETLNVAEPASFEFIRGDINELASLLPADIRWDEALVTDSFAGVAYGNPTEVLANILNALPEGVALTVTLGDTRIRLPGGDIVTLVDFLKGREGFEVTETFSPFEQDGNSNALARAGYKTQWNPEVSAKDRGDYERDHHLHGFTVKRTSGTVSLPRLRLVEILDAYGHPKPRLFEVVMD